MRDSVDIFCIAPDQSSSVLNILGSGQLRQGSLDPAASSLIRWNHVANYRSVLGKHPWVLKHNS